MGVFFYLKSSIFAFITYHIMSAKIRKLTLSYPFIVDGRQQRSVFTVNDKLGATEKTVHTIIETFDQFHQKMKYQICVGQGSHVKLWKEVTPDGCTIELEYHLD